VTTVTWSNSAAEANGPCHCTTSWYVSGISINNGSNTITVTAWDAEGNEIRATITVVYSIPNSFDNPAPMGSVAWSSYSGDVIDFQVLQV
jgi:hypothetical protein